MQPKALKKTPNEPVDSAHARPKIPRLVIMKGDRGVSSPCGGRAFVEATRHYERRTRVRHSGEFASSTNFRGKKERGVEVRDGARTHGPQAIELGAPKERVSHTQSESVPPGVPPSLDPLPEPAVAASTLIRSLNERARSRVSARGRKIWPTHSSGGGGGGGGSWPGPPAAAACRNPWLATSQTGRITSKRFVNAEIPLRATPSPKFVLFNSCQTLYRANC